MAQLNNTIMEKVWLESGNDFQQRVPNPTQAGIAKTVETLFDPMNQDLYNRFMATLINRVGTTIVHNKDWANPLAVFKRGQMMYGNTIQEVIPKWVQAHAYDYNSVLLDVNRPEAAQWFHSVNRQDRYPISISRDELRRAFTDEYGLNNLINGILRAPVNSDNYDEYLIMRQLIAEYETRWGFYKDNLTAAPDTEEGSKELLRKVKSYAGKLKFPSTIYNAKVFEDVPVFADPSELVLFVTPDVEAYLDVNVLASLFHVELADIDVRRITIDEFPIPNAVALLTTQDWFVCADTVYQTTSFFDASTMMDNYWLQHWGVYSMSPCVPAILFTTGGASTEVATVKKTITGLKLDTDVDTVVPGGLVKFAPKIEGTMVASDGTTTLEVTPNSVTYEVTSTKELNTRTYVDARDVLHTQKSGLVAGDTITVKATSTYINPSGKTEVYTAEKVITVA